MGHIRAQEQNTSFGLSPQQGICPKRVTVLLATATHIASGPKARATIHKNIDGGQTGMGGGNMRWGDGSVDWAHCADPHLLPFAGQFV